MVKAVEYLDKTIFNYLGEQNSAIFLAYTNLYGESVVETGLVWAQFDDEHITAIVVSGANNDSLAFVSENADLEELKFVLNKKVITTSKLPFSEIDKKYLLVKNVENTSCEKGIKYTDFNEIKFLSGELSVIDKDIICQKSYLNLKNRCEGALVSENGENISGGFINFADDFSIITDVFTKETYRGKGYGRQIVNKLLSLSKHKNVYLTSKEHNLEFYKKLGFEISKEIYEYKI